MKPILYDAAETEFRSNGMGRLSDAISCKVVEERNGQYELEMKYPVTGIHYADIQEERIIASRHDDTDDIQPFRIYKITRPMNGQVEVNARHISYQLSKVTVMPMTAESCADAFAAMKTNSVGDNPFEFWTDKDVEGPFRITQPVSLRSYLGGTAGSILDVYGTGEYEWDKYMVKFHTHRGSDTGVTIRYGKNLTDVKKITDSSGIWTGIVPFWYGLDQNESEVLVTLPEKAVYADTAGDYAYRMVIPVDFTTSFQSVPTAAQLRETAGAYVRNNADRAIPSSIDVSFVNLWQTEEYQDVAPLQRLKLCDTVTIHHRTLGVENKAKIVSVTYDVLLERYTTMTIGEVRTSLGEAIQEAVSSVNRNDVATLTSMELAIRHATDVLAGIFGGHLKFILNSSGQPEGFYIMDTADASTAVKVLRINASGISFSSNGIGGSFSAAWPLDGKFNANFIKTGAINASLITTGALNATLMTTGILLLKRGTKERLYANFATGELRLTPDSFEMANGDTLESIAAQAASDALDAALLDAVSGEVSDVLPAAVNAAVASAVPTAVSTEVTNQLPAAVSAAVNNAVPTAVNAAVPSAVSSEVASAVPEAVNAAVPTAVASEVASAVPTAVNATVPTAVASEVASVVPTAVSAAVSDAMEQLPLDLFGGGTIGVDGTCSIPLDQGFTTESVYYVFLTKEGEGDLYISAKGANSFTVTGTAGLAFAWNLKYQVSTSSGEGE